MIIIIIVIMIMNMMILGPHGGLERLGAPRRGGRGRRADAVLGDFKDTKDFPDGCGSQDFCEKYPRISPRDSQGFLRRMRFSGLKGHRSFQGWQGETSNGGQNRHWLHRRFVSADKYDQGLQGCGLSVLRIGYFVPRLFVCVAFSLFI